MNYFKKAELARIYHVSEKSVRNWIEAVNEGKLGLDLYELEDRQYILNTTKNALIIEDLVARGRKYKNSRAHKIVTPPSEFYKTYNEHQIYDIIGRLEKYHEFPFQYAHFGKNIDECVNYFYRLWSEHEVPNGLTFSAQFLESNADYLCSLLGNPDVVNVLEIGGRNALLAKGLLQALNRKETLGRYIDVDISEGMLRKASENIHSWLGESAHFEGHARDISRDQFDDLLMSSSGAALANGRSAGNLVLFLAGTLFNLMSPSHALQVIRQSLGKDDIFVCSGKLDTEGSRRFFDFTSVSKKQLLPAKEDFMISMLGLDDTYFESEQFYDKERHARFIQLRLKYDVTIQFDLKGVQRSIDFLKGEALILWLYWHKSAFEFVQMLDQNGFDLLHATCTPGQEQLLVVTKPKRDRISL